MSETVAGVMPAQVSEQSESRLVPVILAGGAGTRLWPLSRAAFPKHLVELVDDRSLLQETAKRLLQIASPQRVITIAAAGQAVLVRRQLTALEPALTENLILEPEPRNTAAAVALAAEYARQRWGEDVVLWICPSDHLIVDSEALLGAARIAVGAAQAGRIVTFGITPTRAETGFGWIAVGLPNGVEGVREVREFVEKPPAAEAQRMLDSADYLWNSGMFVFRADVMLEELSRFEPDLARGAAAALKSMQRGRDAGPDPAIYTTLPSLPIDKAVMERSRRVAVIPCDPTWSDVGSWRALFELMPKDAAGNAVQGDAVLENARDNLVRAEHRLVALTGVSGLAVIETADAVLVGDLQSSDSVRALVGQLARTGRSQAFVHCQEHRPWGVFTTIGGGPGFRVREVVVSPGARMGKQRHPSRDRFWVIVSGRARLEVDGGAREIASGQSATVPRGSVNRLGNAGSVPLRVIEIALGDVVNDDATERFPD
jgi:mannose-1-phosphate guanylyltransferase/mannose-6-phosphate isomerase